MSDLFERLKNPESQERKIMLMLAQEEIENIFGDFFEIYNVTEKDKAELLARLVTWNTGIF